MVPRYFMSLRYRGRLFADEEGDELQDDEAARAYAAQVARDLTATHRMTTIRNWLDCIFEITDESGRLVAEVPFADAANRKLNTL